MNNIIMIGMVVGQLNEQAQTAMKVALAAVCFLWVSFYFVNKWKGE